MRNRLRASLLLTLLAVSAVACNRPRRGSGGLELHRMQHAGLERTYRLIVPPGYDSEQPVPLVLALHGGGGSSQQMCTLSGGIQELSELEGFLVACPDAIESHWNDGRGNVRYRSQADDLDDVGFLLALLDRLEGQYRIDPARIYVTGASNGGMMTQRMVCEASDTLAAAAVVIASLPAALECHPERPIPMLFINGTEDPLMPYAGGQVRFYRQELGAVLSTADTIEFWASANGCHLSPQSELLPDRDPDDGTRVRLDRYADCDQAAAVLAYTVEGGGHTWPGGAQYAPIGVIGRVSKDLAANEVIWAFFEAASEARLSQPTARLPAATSSSPATPAASVTQPPPTNDPTAVATDWVPSPTPTLLPGSAPTLPRLGVGYVTHGDRSLPWVALTFDVGQTPDNPAGFDEGIVAALQAHRAPATFFLGGDWMRTHMAETRQLDAEPLFELGNHSWSHPDMRELTEPQMHAEVVRTQEMLYQLTGHQTLLFRFPSGWHNDLALSVVAWNGLYSIQWDVVIADPVPDNTAENILKLIQERTQNGSIVVMHANGRGWHTAEAVPLMVEYLRGEGYCLVRVSQMIGLEPGPEHCP